MILKTLRAAMFQPTLVAAGLTLALSLVFIRVYSAQSLFFIPLVGDDAGYYAHSVGWLEAGGYDYCHPAFRGVGTLHETCRQGRVAYNQYTPGPALVLLPFTVLGKLLSGVYSPPLPYLLFWSLVGTAMVFFLTIWLLYDLAQRNLGDRKGFWVTLYFLLGNALLFYVFRRPLMAHAVEVLAFSLCAWLVMTRKPALLLGAASGLLVLTRLNDVFWLPLFGFLAWRRGGLRGLLEYGLGGLPMAVIFLGVQWAQTGSLLYKTQSYSADFSLGTLLGFAPENLLRMADFWVGPHWGWVWIMPFLLLEVWAVGWALYRGRWPRAEVLVAALVSLLILNLMANLPNHMSYGHRLLITQVVGLHVLFIAVGRVVRSQWIHIFGVVGAILATSHLWNYQSNSELTLTHNRASEAGVVSPKFKDRVMLTAPNYVVRSTLHTLKGRSWRGFGASPLLAYPVTLLGIEVPYYKKHGVHGMGDLRILTHYLLWVFAFLLMGVSVFFWRFRHGH